MLAHRRHDLTLAALALVTLTVGLGHAASAVTLDEAGVAVGAAAVFALVEAVALLAERDPFWQRPARAVGAVVELAATPATIALAGTVALAGLFAGWNDPDATSALAAGLLAAGWLLADRRRVVEDDTAIGLSLLMGSRWWPATAGAGVGVSGAVMFSTASVPATAVALLLIGGLSVVTDRAGAAGLAPLFTLAASFVLGDEAIWGIGIGLAGTALLGVQAGLRAVAADRARPGSGGDTVVGLALVSVIPAALGLSAGHDDIGLLTTALIAVTAGWGLAVVLDRAGTAGLVDLGWVGRASVVALLATMFELPASEGVFVAAAVTVVLLAESRRRRDPAPLYGLAASLPAATATAAVALGGEPAEGGVAMVALGTASLLIATRLPRDWAWALGVTGASAAGIGITLTTEDPSALATALILGGVALVAFGLRVREVALQGLGAATTVAGVWLHLSVADVQALDAYALPVALVLAVVGLRADPNEPVSSWVRFGPAVLLAGVPALAERLAGGPGIHALVAGVVGVVAVTFGGWRRMTAPLLLGTALLVALAGYETVSVTAGIPTWVWLASGGALLVGAGVLMERHETGPVETGRRVVDVLTERYQ